MPRAWRSSRVKARPLLSLGSRKWSMPITWEGVMMSPVTSWYCFLAWRSMAFMAVRRLLAVAVVLLLHLEPSGEMLLSLVDL